jgi:hypothetical protein
MKKKLVAVALLSVCVWLWWPRTEAAPPVQQQRNPCPSLNGYWCYGYCSRDKLEPNWQGYEKCVPTCLAQRSPTRCSPLPHGGGGSGG